MKENIPYSRLDSRYTMRANPVFDASLVQTPSAIQNITAAGGITVTHGVMRIQGNGAPVTITKDPQIANGTDGEFVYLVGMSATNSVTITTGNGLNIRGPYTLLAHDWILLSYESAHGHWEEVNRNASESEKAWSFRNAGTGTNYAGGFYIFNTGNDDFTSTQTIGSANLSYAAHAFLVLGESTSDDVTIRFTGTSITDLGVRTTSDTEDIVFTHPAVADAYVETNKKWIGQVSIDHVSGTAVQCNWGYAKYWDSNNNDYRITGLEVTWLGGFSDSPDIQLIHHTSAGWTYNVGAAPTPPTPIASLQGDHVTEYQVANGVEGAWKRSNLQVKVEGSNSEGTIWAIVTTANNAFSIGNIMMRIRPD